MFLLSIILVCLSSYIVTSILIKKSLRQNIGLIYIGLTAFAQIILSFEILSLIGQIGRNQMLACNILSLACAVVIWRQRGFPVYKPDLLSEIKAVKKALDTDKLLKITAVSFIIFIFLQCITALFFPITSGDAFAYYFTRCTSWIQNGSINHFATPDTRELIMPVNMDFLYTWNLLFIKTERGTAIYTYIALINLLYVVYNFLGELSFCRRKRLWCIFAVSSFIIFGIMAHNPCAELLAGSLILTCIYLCYVFIKTNNISAIYSGTLAGALAMGTKTTAITGFPSIFLAVMLINFFINKETIKKNSIIFIVFTAVNFLIFSSYNYILNFMDFGNPVSNSEQLMIHRFRGGILGYISNLIKYFFVIFDFSGLEGIDIYNNTVMFAQSKLLAIFGLTPESCTSKLFNGIYEYNSSISILSSGLGALGLLIFLPSIIKSLYCGIMKHSVKVKILMVLSLSLIFNILVFSRVMVFAGYNIRYLVTFAAAALPVAVLSYIKSNKNIFKWILLCFIITSFCLIVFTPAVNLYNRKFLPDNIAEDENKIYDYFINKKPCKIAVMAYFRGAQLYQIEKLKLKGFKIDKILVQNIEYYNLSKYDYIITNIYKINSGNICPKQGSTVKCSYYDSDLNTQNECSKDKTTFVSCFIPFKYLQQKGFEKVSDEYYSKYILLKNSNGSDKYQYLPGIGKYYPNNILLPSRSER